MMFHVWNGYDLGSCDAFKYLFNDIWLEIV